MSVSSRLSRRFLLRSPLWRACQEMTDDLNAAERAALFRETAMRVYRIELPPSVSYRGGGARDQAGERRG